MGQWKEYRLRRNKIFPDCWSYNYGLPIDEAFVAFDAFYTYQSVRVLQRRQTIKPKVGKVWNVFVYTAMIHLFKLFTSFIQKRHYFFSTFCLYVIWLNLQKKSLLSDKFLKISKLHSFLQSLFLEASSFFSKIDANH